MLRPILLFSLRSRGVVLALAAALLVYGTWSAAHVKLDVLPDFAPPQVEVQTEAPGLSPEQVEALVTQPVEQALGGLAGLRSLRSESIQGLSVVRAVFAEDVDPHAARQLLAESVASATSRLPVGVGPPRLSPLTSATMDVLKLGLVSDRLSPMELRTLADWTVRPRLLMVPGVARVNVFGGEVRQVQIRPRLDALVAHGLGLGDVVVAARDAVAIRGAGFVETANQRVTLAAQGEPVSLEALAENPIAVRDGLPLRLGDVVDVVEAAAPRFGDALIQGRPGVLLTLSSQWGANTLDVTYALEAALAELAPLFEREGVVVYPALHRPANFIEASLGSVRTALLVGSALVIAVLALFLRDLRTAFISVTAIPLSLLAAVVVLRLHGATLNTMTLGGLAIAIGEVVDDAIVDVENIARRLRENGARPDPLPALRVVLDASLEVRRSIGFATACVVLVFVPLLTLGGLAGSFFSPLAQSYLLAVLASLLVAVTVTPALSLSLLGGSRTADEPRIQTRLRAAYRRALSRALARPGGLGLAAAGVAALALLLLPFLGGELLPEFRERHLVLQVSTRAGASLAETLRLGRRISEAVLALPGVASVEQQVGRAELGEDTWGPNRSEFHVELRPMSGADETRTTERVRDLLDGVPGIQSEVLTFLGDRISETISGETSEIVVSVFGDDLDALDAIAADVAGVLRGLRGAEDVQLARVGSAPELVIAPAPDRLGRFGFHSAELLDQVATAIQGTPVATLHEGNRITDLVVVLPPDVARVPEAIAALPVRSAGGTQVPLGAVADVSLSDGRGVVLHEGGRRRQVVTCNVSGRDVTSFEDEARRAIADRVKLPAGSFVVFSGSAGERATARRELWLRAGLGALGIALLLGIAARHPRNLAVLLAMLPLSFAGGVLSAAAAGALGLGGAGLSLGALVGFATLFGVTSRNGIMMISHLRHLVEEEGAAWGRETLLLGAGERVVPIVMTALVTGLGLLPVALSADRPGGEIDGPMAIVILGGLAAATVANLFLLPTLCLRFGRFDAREDQPPGA